ncbi:MAG: hypothetical protein ACREOO_19140 [bacterium]
MKRSAWSDSHTVEAAGQTKNLIVVPSLGRSLLIGGVGFCLVSLCVFATVAFAERWMYAQLTMPGAYLAWTALFILLGGGILGSLVAGKWRLPKFYLLFGAAFFAYAVGWVTAYAIWRDGAGEWLGSFAGSILMGLVLSAGFGVVRSTLNLSAVLFVANSVGYFVGSAVNNAVNGSTGMLLWGCVYGLCLGAGLGAVLHFVQYRRADESASKQNSRENLTI